ncbi:hypothetical protein ILUMI_10101 [Ignelater luminosus]|uniref:Uncharacterized protein n=1 Tax=Ignelater luminosus TaxID=2038154 RepID=A0A8K0CYJ7_IGNLU|nr:hypothetical protein ILUMI_10101 [Ignelater luminosus]
MDYYFEYEEATPSSSTNKPEDKSSVVLREFTFEMVIKGVLTYVAYKDYIDHYFLAANQRVGELGAGRIEIKQFPAEHCPDGEFSFSLVKECEGFRDAAKIIALALAVRKPLYLHLCLADYKSEMVNNVVLKLLKLCVSFEIFNNHGNFADVAKLIVLKLDIDKSLYLYLGLSDLEEETTMDVMKNIPSR